MIDTAESRDRRDATLAGVCAAFMIGHQVAGKATRDALFLSSYSVVDLPLMWITAAVFSLVFVFAGAGLLSRRGPMLIIPRASVIWRR
jgi:AAA family ATP:ADP antiporter